MYTYIYLTVSKEKSTLSAMKGLLELHLDAKDIFNRFFIAKQMALVHTVT
jgi:hypothetical protein